MSKVKVFFCRLVVALGAGALNGQSTTSEPQALGSQENAVPVIRVQVNRVLVPVVVTDKAGNPVAGLAKEDFQVFDEGKQHGISALTVLGDKAAGDKTAANGAVEANHAAEANGTAAAQQTPLRFVVFLVDDLHMDVRNLKYVQKAASALSGSLDPSDYAGLILMSNKAPAHMTRDRAKLIADMNDIQNRQVFQHTGLECPDISYYQAIQIDRDRMADSPPFQSAMASAATCFPGAEANALEGIVRQAVQKVLNEGRQDALTSYSAIAWAVQAMSRLPGERQLILISPGFETIEQEAYVAESRVLDMALQSNVRISALDVRGVYVGNIGADEKGMIVTAKVDANAVQQDLRLSSMSNESSAMASLAYETGGSFFHNNNDLQKGFRELTQAPRVEYLLELSPDGLKADGRYHSLAVKVRQKGVTVVARRGYVVRKPDDGKKK